MNPIIESLYSRKSVRVFEDQPVPPEVKRAVLEAAAQAPTAGNQQLYTILDITGPGAESQPRGNVRSPTLHRDRAVVLVFLADCEKWLRAYRLAGCDARLPA